MHPSVSGVADGSIFTKSSSMLTATVEYSHQKRSPVLAVFIGVTAALIFGSADFAGGMAAKRISAVRVTAIGGLSGLVILLLAFPLFPSVWSTKAVLLGGVTGITGAFAVVLLYACLAIGPMSILSPLTAVISAMVPVLAGVVRGEHRGGLGYVAIVVAFVAVVLVGFVPEKGAVRPSLRALAMAVGAGALIGAFLILIDLTPRDSGLVPLVMSRTVNAIVMFSAIGIGALLARRRGTTPRAVGGWKPGLVLAIVAGVIDAIANALLLFGLRQGELTIQSVLTALYPAGTILLAAIVLRERIAPIQIVGLVLALVAAAMLAVG
ncbi:DMT family transporter [Glaciihabitans sp. GrIS 2.15]|uniref:DMT family transporter n=1 Tax=Glaciihabitans sp. GrIS 2.15 TaxID=3071710 RepID=UPI002DFB7063|nr:drug/metabolite transporter (DMT)-like permease [Glaciihabitans sp. GrIS 2.15]